MKQLIIPPYLKEGDHVEIVSPSGVIDRDIVLKAAKKLEASGLVVTIGKNAFKNNGCFAGTDLERLSDLQEATSDPDIKAVFCSRGGYGVSRIIDRVDFSPLKENPKWYIGFSDITVLHLWLSKMCGMVSLHGEMPLNYFNPKKSVNCYDTMINALFGKPEAIAWKCNREANIDVSGPVTGGNLSLIYSLIGTPAEPDTDGSILFIEDVGEFYYHLDRMLTSMRLSGCLSNLRALVVGGMERITEGSMPYSSSIEEIILDIVGQYNYPVLFNFPAGHISDNRAIYIGREARLFQERKEASLMYI
ncbi:MAG TPA: LD-carboxypeptidase [Bacteroidales bacterium]|nr:LD-carboxypeptidase [Bacteroidales bacterium]